jgi:hypothetical protein
MGKPPGPRFLGSTGFLKKATSLGFRRLVARDRRNRVGSVQGDDDFPADRFHRLDKLLDGIPLAEKTIAFQAAVAVSPPKNAVVPHGFTLVTRHL